MEKEAHTTNTTTQKKSVISPSPAKETTMNVVGAGEGFKQHIERGETESTRSSSTPKPKKIPILRKLAKAFGHQHQAIGGQKLSLRVRNRQRAAEEDPKTSSTIQNDQF